MTLNDKAKLEQFARNNKLSDQQTDILVEMVEEMIEDERENSFRSGQLSTLPD